MRDRTLATLLGTALAPLAWGSTYVVTSQALPAGHPVFSAAARALPAGLLLLALVRTLPSGAWWWRSLVLGALNIGAFFPLLFLAAYRLPGGVAATLGATSPLVVAGFAWLLLGQRAGTRRLAWGVAGIVGVGLMVLQAQARLDAVGVAAGLLGTLSMGAGTVLTKKWGMPAGPVPFAAWQLTWGGILLVPAAALLEPVPALTPAAGLGYAWLAAVGSALAYPLWFRGLSRLDVTAAAFLPLLSPVTAALLGFAVLRESLTAPQLAGFVLAVASVVAAQLGPTRPALPMREPAVTGART